MQTFNDLNWYVVSYWKFDNYTIVLALFDCQCCAEHYVEYLLQEYSMRDCTYTIVQFD